MCVHARKVPRKICASQNKKLNYIYYRTCVITNVSVVCAAKGYQSNALQLGAQLLVLLGFGRDQQPSILYNANKNKVRQQEKAHTEAA